MDDLSICQRDSYVKISRNTVISCKLSDKSEKSPTYEIILDDCVLYPEGGGQPCDFGTVAGFQATQIERCESNEKTSESNVKVFLSVPLEKGSEVECIIDWKRRYDHMQQHTSQCNRL